VHERFAPDEQQIADVVLDADVDDITRLVEGHTTPLFRIEPIDGKPAEGALRVAHIRDRELEIARPRMIQNLGEEFKGTSPRPDDFR
jgi:hypothetical protein